MPQLTSPDLSLNTSASPPAAASQRTIARHAKAQLAAQVAAAMRAQGLTKTEFARRMGTSRSALDRLLDASHTRLTLATLAAVADVLGRRVDVRLVPESAPDRSAALIGGATRSARAGKESVTRIDDESAPFEPCG